MAKPPSSRQTSPRVSTIASKILSGELKNPSPSQMKSVAASALAQDQSKGQAPKKR